MSVITRRPRRDPWFEFSRGQYYMKSGEAINFYNCVQYSGGVAARTYGGVGRQGKIEVLQYADATGVEPCPGIVWESVIDETAAVTQISAGYNVAREISTMRKGFLYMVYNEGVGSTTTPYYGMKIAPHPSGFQQWKTGMFLLGKFADEANTNGVDFSTPEHPSLRTYRVEIDVSESEVSSANSLAELTDTTITTITAGDVMIYNGTAYVNCIPIVETLTTSTHVATLSQTPVGGLHGVIALATAAVVLVEVGTPATTQGEYDLTTTALTFNATDAVTTTQVSYYYARS